MATAPSTRAIGALSRAECGTTATTKTPMTPADECRGPTTVPQTAETG